MAPPAVAGPDDDTAEVADAADGAAAQAEWRQGTVDASQHGERLDKVLVGLVPEFSRNYLQALVQGGRALVDGQSVVVPSRRVRAGQALRIELVPTAESRAFTPQAMPLAIVYEDEQLLVVDKPVGLVVHPAAGHWSGTLLNGLLAHHAGAAALPRAGIVHRLDKDTSGLMVVGKTLAAVTALSRAIAAREVHRRYLALAHGSVMPVQRCVDAPIGRDPASRVRMKVLAGGRPARTDLRCLCQREGISALSCTLHTGRTHQIRVHLAAIGHPLVADALYGGAEALGMTRQALHATQLRLQHPTRGDWLDFTAPPPADFAEAWARVCGASAGYNEF